MYKVKLIKYALVYMYSCVQRCSYCHSNTNCKVLVLVIDACATSPCQNGAKCSTSQLVRYSCDCLTGYTGHNCETGKLYHYHLTGLHTNISQRDSSDVLIESTPHSTQRRQGTLWCIQ